jgi:hypothetical protein
MPFDKFGNWYEIDPSEAFGTYGQPPQRTSPTGGIPDLYGQWTSYAGTTEGDRWSQGPQGVWDLNPLVNYGAPPEAGMTPYFGNDGRIAGWGGERTGDSGTGLFGNFGGDQTRTTYTYNPDGTLAKGQEVHSPSRDSMTNMMSFAAPIAMAAGLGYGGMEGAFSGMGGAEGLGMGAAPGEAAGGFTWTGATPAAGGLGATAAGGGLPGGATSALGKVGSAVGSIGSALGGGSNLGGLLGGGIGGLLGYLDAKNQPDSLTVKQEIDPRLAQYAYGADGKGGIAGAANTLMQQQMGQPNPLTEAGKQISGMANTLPNWSELVNQSQSQWSANPFIEQQQKAITDLATRNLKENVLPGIGSQAGYAGGYGGSRQGVAEALAMSRLNTDLAPALTGLASNAWESGQNRALNSAQSAGSYGLNNQAQQAGLLGTGAGLQMSAPWAPINNATNVMRALPGNQSTTQPLFTNPWAGAAGGASVGSQIGGGTNWGDLFKNIGGLFK